MNEACIESKTRKNVLIIGNEGLNLDTIYQFNLDQMSAELKPSTAIMGPPQYEV
jgi:hypothetical protein